MTNDLDLLYGPCLPAGRPIESLELQMRPNSLQLLDRAGYEALAAYLQSANSLKIPRIVHQQMTILWVMNEAAQIYVAFEELIDTKSGQYLMPYLRDNTVVRLIGRDIAEGRIGRLGHPSLLEGARTARIGGEIVFRPNDGDEHLWKINRASGRYGLRHNQTNHHLEAVRSLFNSNGLHLGLE
jgi:hypothetical protein